MCTKHAFIIQSGFIQLAKSYIETFNKGEVPCISSAAKLIDDDADSITEPQVSLFNNIYLRETRGEDIMA